MDETGHIGCVPMHPMHFRHMNPRQRRMLAERRRLEVEAARRHRPRPQPRYYHPDVIPYFLDALAPLLWELPMDVCGCGERAYALGMCHRMYDRVTERVG